MICNRPVLVTMSTFRLIFAFLLTFNVTTWVKSMGYFGAFGIYTGALAGVALFLPLVFFWGKRIRHWSAGSLERTENKRAKKVVSSDSESDLDVNSESGEEGSSSEEDALNRGRDDLELAAAINSRWSSYRASTSNNDAAENGMPLRASDYNDVDLSQPTQTQGQIPEITVQRV